MRYLFWTPLLLTICVVSNASSQELIGSVEVLDEALTDLVSADAQLEVLAEGFVWSEGRFGLVMGSSCCSLMFGPIKFISGRRTMKHEFSWSLQATQDRLWKDVSVDQMVSH